MKRKIVISTGILLVMVVGVIFYLTSINYFAPTPHCTDFENITSYNRELENRVGSNRLGLRKFPTKFIIDWGTIENIDRQNGKYVLAVFGMQADTLAVNVLGSNSTGDGVSTVRPVNYPSIRTAESDLKNHLQSRDINQDIKVKDFPLVLKMDTKEFLELRRETNCPAFICYIGIEPGGIFQKGNVTVGVAASDRAGLNPDSRYFSAGADELCAAETWPSRNFTLAKTPSASTDIILP